MLHHLECCSGEQMRVILFSKIQIISSKRNFPVIINTVLVQNYNIAEVLHARNIYCFTGDEFINKPMSNVNLA